MRRIEAIFDALLRCYPAAFRNEYGAQMRLMFDEQLRDARDTNRRRVEAGLLLRTFRDACTVAPREHWHILSQDLRYALRSMLARPGFTAVAIASLALGIGANTAIFSLWHSVLHAPLPGIRAPEELVMLSNPDETGSWTGGWDGREGPRSWLTYQEFEDLRRHADSFAALMASQSSLSAWQIRFQGGTWEEARGRLVSENFFDVLGATPEIGRLFTSGDGIRTSPAVISHRYWQRRFGGRPDVLGATFNVRQAALTVIGVTRPGFIGETAAQQPDFWLPLAVQPIVLPDRDRLHDTPPDKSMWLHVFGRLRPGVTFAHAEAQANAILQANLAAFHGASLSPERRAEIQAERLELRAAANGASSARSDLSTSLTALLIALAILLLIACVNLANLLLARVAARRAEIALRLSLGASRQRLLRQLVTENLTLTALGGAAGLVVAAIAHDGLVGMITRIDNRFAMDFTLEPRVLGFTLTVTMAAGLLLAVLPAWQATRTDPGAALKDQGRGAGGGRGQLRAGRAMVSLQLALSLPLLVGAGLMAQTVYNLQATDLGFRAGRLLLMRVDLQDVAGEAPRQQQVLTQLRDALQAIPGVNRVSFSRLGVFTGGFSNTGVEVEGFVPRGERDKESAVDIVGPDYFTALGVPIIQGRDILAGDSGDTAGVCVINQAFARQFFAGRDPLGMRITTDGIDYRVIGVAGDARTDGLRDAVPSRYFVAALQRPQPPLSPTFLIRADTELAPIVRAAREAVQDVNPGVAILSSRTLEERMQPLIGREQMTAQLSLVFGVMALTLAALGLYGVLSYGTARRSGEIAVRIALGAQPRRVVWMILWETAGLVLAGLAVGAALAVGASRLIASQLYGVTADDMMTSALASGLLLIVALVAAYVPARRASRLSPMTALHQ